MDQKRKEDLLILFDTLATLERRVANEWNNRNELGFSKSHILLLDYLATEGPKRPSAIAEKLQVTTGGVTVLTTKLLKHGFIERTQNENDRRAAQITITDSGRAILEQSKAHVDVLINRLFGTLSHDEIQVLQSIFNKCIHTSK